MAGTNNGFISRLQTASREKLIRNRSRSVMVGRVVMVVAIVFFLGAVLAAIAHDRSEAAQALALAVLHMVIMMSVQVRVWFIDLVLSGKTTSDESCR